MKHILLISSIGNNFEYFAKRAAHLHIPHALRCSDGIWRMPLTELHAVGANNKPINAQQSTENRFFFCFVAPKLISDKECVWIDNIYVYINVDVRVHITQTAGETFTPAYTHDTTASFDRYIIVNCKATAKNGRKCAAPQLHSAATHERQKSLFSNRRRGRH